MNLSRKQKRPVSFLLLLSLMVLALLGGCRQADRFPSPTTAAPYTEETAESYEHYEEAQLKAQADFDREMEDLFREEVSADQIDLHFILKDPAAFGIEKAKNLYSPVSLEAMAESETNQAELKERLDTFDTALLTDEQKLTKRILQSLLKTEDRSRGLALYVQPLSVTIGVQAQLPILLSEYAFYRKEDVEDYLRLLDGIDGYYAQLLDFEKQKAEAGLMMSDKTLDHVIASCESYLLDPDNNFMTDTFNSRLEALPGLSEEEAAAFRQRNQELLQSSFVPAYQRLIDGLESLRGTGTNEKGLCGFPKGKEYYEYLVYSSTGTSYGSVEDMLTAMEDAIDKQALVISRLLQKQPELAEQMDSLSYRQTEPNGIMDELKQLSLKSFPPLPECSYTFKSVPKALELSLSPAFYLTSPLDDYQDNVIYINENPRFSGDDLYNTIAHEGYPGHLYQNVYFHTHCDSNLRRMLSFRGYSEGWATYVEQLSYTMDNGLSSELGQLLAANSLASLGIHACLDVYVNYYGWGLDEIEEYLELYYDYDDAVLDEAAEALFDAMVENPSNYLSYYVGCLEIMNMRETAEKQLGERFDEKAFHTFLLDIGDAPFDVIQAYFTSWLQDNSQ